MPTARYWRLTRIESYDHGDLVLSEVAFYEGAVRVDASATISSVLPQSSGTLSDLSDNDFGTNVSWPAISLFLPGFAIVWDFGSARDIVKVGVASPTQSNFAYRFAVDYSSDGITWTNFLPSFQAVKWIASNTLAERTGNDPGTDPLFGNVDFLIRDDLRNLEDSSTWRRPFSILNTVAVSDVVGRFGTRTVRFANSATLAVPNAPSMTFGAAPMTAEGWFRFDTVNVIAQVLFSRWGGSTAGWLLALGTGGTLIFQVNGQTTVISGATTLVANTWYHIAVSGQSGVGIRVFLNGVQQGVTYTTALNNTNEEPNFRISGRADTASRFTGYASDIRVTTGVSRYNSDFSPPTARFFDEFGDTAQPLRGETPFPIRIVEYDPPAFGVSLSAPIPLQLDQEDGGRFRIVGTVKEVALPVNTPLARRVALYEERSGRLVKRTFSDNAGNYSFTEIRGDRPYTVIAFDHTDTYRAVIADKINAEPMP